MAVDAACRAEALAKLEFFNPSASEKHRIALSILEAMEVDGTIGPGSVIVEPTSGQRDRPCPRLHSQGYRCIPTMPDSFSIERRTLMRFLGADLLSRPARDGNAVMPWPFGPRRR